MSAILTRSWYGDVKLVWLIMGHIASSNHKQMAITVKPLI